MQQQRCSNKEASALKIRPRGSLQNHRKHTLRGRLLTAGFPTSVRATRVQQDAIRVCNNTRYERAIDAPQACNTTRYMRAIDTLLCATTHYGMCESGALHDTGELPSALHDTGELQGALYDTGELTRPRQDTKEVQIALSNKSLPSPQTHCFRAGSACSVSHFSGRILTALTLRIRVRAAKISA
jgi:hypothetical protein